MTEPSLLRHRLAQLPLAQRRLLEEGGRGDAVEGLRALFGEKLLLELRKPSSPDSMLSEVSTWLDRYTPPPLDAPPASPKPHLPTPRASALHGEERVLNAVTPTRTPRYQEELALRRLLLETPAFDARRVTPERTGQVRDLLRGTASTSSRIAELRRLFSLQSKDKAISEWIRAATTAMDRVGEDVPGLLCQVEDALLRARPGDVRPIGVDVLRTVMGRIPSSWKEPSSEGAPPLFAYQRVRYANEERRAVRAVPLIARYESHAASDVLTQKTLLFTVVSLFDYAPGTLTEPFRILSQMLFEPARELEQLTRAGVPLPLTVVAAVQAYEPSFGAVTEAQLAEMSTLHELSESVTATLLPRSLLAEWNGLFRRRPDRLKDPRTLRALTYALGDENRAAREALADAVALSMASPSTQEAFQTRGWSLTGPEQELCARALSFMEEKQARGLHPLELEPA